MNERKRQAYLEAMDIQVYFPLQQLAAAKPSPKYDFPPILTSVPDLVEQDAGTSVGSSSSKGKASGLEAIEELRSDSTATRKTTVTKIRPLEETPEGDHESDSADDQQSSLSFTLRYYRVSENLAVLDEVPPQGSHQLSEDSALLMKAILKAVGQEPMDSLGQKEEFTWPLHRGYSMKNTPEIEAAKAINGFLQMRQETDGFTNLLVFAGQVEEVFLAANTDTNNRDFEGSKGYFLTVTHSLASMLAVPILKRDVWQHLQALKKRIESSS